MNFGESAQKAEFSQSGAVTCRGEYVSSYEKGDIIMILDRLGTDIFQILVTSGESEGKIMYVGKDDFQIKV